MSLDLPYQPIEHYGVIGNLRTCALVGSNGSIDWLCLPRFEGIYVDGALVGERWEIGSAVLEVSEPRIPCWRLGVRMNDRTFPRRFAEAMRPGAYLRIVVEGSVAVGDEIRIVERPGHDLTVRDVSRIYLRDRDEIERLLAVPQVSESWRRWMHDILQGTKGPPDAGDPGCC